MKRVLLLAIGAIASSLILLESVKLVPYPYQQDSNIVTGTITYPVSLQNNTEEPSPETLRLERERQRRLERQLECLAKNIYHEARGEPYEGKVAVAQVTVNRARSGKFPNDVCEVVYQKTRGPDDIVVCQFSWWCIHEIRSQPVSRHEYRESYRIAKKVFVDGEELPHLKQALFFHARDIDPQWGRPIVAHIGQHIFYR